MQCVQDLGCSDIGDNDFTIHNTALAYYVNDTSTVNDVYCTVAGSDTNDGVTVGTPKASIQAILDAYDLEPGDTVYVDTGNYSLTNNVEITSDDVGSSAGNVRLVGSPGGTVLDRGSTTVNAACLYLNAAQHVWVENLTCTGGYYGIRIYNANNCVLKGNLLLNNSEAGIYNHKQLLHLPKITAYVKNRFVGCWAFGIVSP